jgi:hypothetical protein
VLSKATTFDRRQRVLRLPDEQPGIRVADIARPLSVSESTIRNDLDVPAETGHLARVSGGALPIDGHPGKSKTSIARLRALGAAEKVSAPGCRSGGGRRLDPARCQHTAHFVGTCLRDRLITSSLPVPTSTSMTPMPERTLPAW